MCWFANYQIFICLWEILQRYSLNVSLTVLFYMVVPKYLILRALKILTFFKNRVQQLKVQDYTDCYISPQWGTFICITPGQKILLSGSVCKSSRRNMVIFWWYCKKWSLHEHQSEELAILVSDRGKVSLIKRQIQNVKWRLICSRKSKDQKDR